MRRLTTGGSILALLAAVAVAGAEKSQTQIAPAAKGEAMKGLIRASLTRSNLTPQGPRQYTDEVTDPGVLRRLAEAFPGAGQGKASPVSGKWEAFTKIELHRATGKPVVVRVDSALDVWSEGKGDWRLPVEFREFFNEILPDHDGVECPGLPYARGEPLAKVKRAKVTRYYDGSNRRLPEPSVTVVTDPESLKFLVDSFPGVDAGNKSPMAGGWVLGTRIELERDDKPTVTVKLSPRRGEWSEGQGDWLIRPGFAGRFARLVGE